MGRWFGRKVGGSILEWLVGLVGGLVSEKFGGSMVGLLVGWWVGG